MRGGGIIVFLFTFVALSLLWSETNLQRTFGDVWVLSPMSTDGVRINNKAKEDSLCNEITLDTTMEDVCHCLSSWVAKIPLSLRTGVPVSDIWRSLKPRVFQSAYNSTKTCWWEEEFAKLNHGLFNKFLDDLFGALNSYRLRRSLRSPANPLVYRQLLQVLLKRLTDPVNNAPLMIAVFGGSVTKGCWTYSSVYGLNYEGGIKCPQECAWPLKLEYLLNQFLGNDTVVVKNFAEGGCDSDIGATFLEYDLWPEDNPGRDFDIIVSAFSANDGVAPPQEEELLYKASQKFLRLAMDQRPCSDLPLVIHLEGNMMDSLANRPSGTVFDNLRFSREATQSALWAGVLQVSYAEAIRDFVYRNSSSHVATQLHNLHPGQGFHTGVAWTLAWNLLNALVESCDAKELPGYGLKEPQVDVPLPILSKDIKTSTVESKWRKQREHRFNLCSQGVTELSPSQCPLKWVASKLGATTKEMIAAAMEPVLVQNSGWKADGYPIKKPRRTWLAETANATFTIQLQNLTVPIDQMLVLYIRSYGSMWKDSRLLLLVEAKKLSEEWTEIYKGELRGLHDWETSINYSHRVPLGGLLQIGNDVRATFSLIGGSRFQVNGIALCRSASAGSIDDLY